MRVFVTGGTGLLGNNIVKELVARHQAVTALARRREARRLLGPGPEVVEGDLRQVRDFEKRLANTEVLIHAAACYGEYYRQGARALPGETNVQGTQGLLEAAERQGVRNVVYISSAAVLKARDGGPVDETSPYNEQTDDPYFASKVEAEKAVLRFLDRHPQIRIVLILPTVMLGPGDVGPTPTGAFVLKLLRGEMRFVLPGWHRIADARDVARAVVEAIDQGRHGERYLVGGRRYSVAEIYQAVTQVSGRPTPTKQITLRKLLLASRLMLLVSRITGRPPALKPNIVRRLQESFWYSSDKAERELGVSFRPLSETMTDTVKWFQSEHPDLVKT
ncbi:MAG: NAD-dependent epimerase/dehydratase family protein [Thermodesulfobacteriota bacterium]